MVKDTPHSFSSPENDLAGDSRVEKHVYSQFSLKGPLKELFEPIHRAECV